MFFDVRGGCLFGLFPREVGFVVGLFFCSDVSFFELVGVGCGFGFLLEFGEDVSPVFPGFLVFWFPFFFGLGF